MNYEKHYELLMLRGRARVKSKNIHFERHHIQPRCMGGVDTKENIVLLTPEEHYVAHQLLVKIFPFQTGLVTAAVLMTTDRYGYRVNNKLFGWIRRRQAKNMAERIISIETRQKISEAGRKRKGIKTNGWNQAAKKRKAESCRGENHNQFGTHRNASTRQKISQSLMGEKRPAYGKKGIDCPNFWSQIHARTAISYI